VGTSQINSLSGFTEQHAPLSELQRRASNTPSSLPSNNTVSRLQLPSLGQRIQQPTSTIKSSALCNRVIICGYTSWISCFSLPQTIITDQGRQFGSQLFHSLAKLCGIKLSRKTASHPAANRLLERFHRTMTAAIMCHADQHWTEALPLVLLASAHH
jgi:transposase InsO family protein